MAEENSNVIQKNTVILRISTSRLGVRRNVNHHKGLKEVEANPEWIRASKIILKSTTLRDLDRVAELTQREARRIGVSYPLKAGHYLIPIVKVVQFSAYLQSQSATWLGQVEKFFGEYPGLVEQAEEDLKDLFNLDNYPAAADVRAEFNFSWEFLQFTTPGTIKAISETLFEEEREKAAKKAEELVDEIQDRIRQEFMQIIRHTSEQITGLGTGEKTFTNASMNKIRGWLQEFKDGRNLTEDEALVAMAENLNSQLSGVSSENIRNSSALQTFIGAECTKIGNELEKLMIDKPKRIYHL